MAAAESTSAAAAPAGPCVPTTAMAFAPVGRALHTRRTDMASGTDPSAASPASSRPPTPLSPSAADDVDAAAAAQSLAAANASSADHYAILGLAAQRWAASFDDIKRAHRAMSLRFHPDKKDNPEEDEHFKAIQKAYELLSDPAKRRLYDSADEFDDWIPEPRDLRKEDYNFYKVFGPVFHRNSRWSNKKPVPLLGDENTPIAEVDKFYDFWFHFSSWREIIGEDAHDLDEAENREERRWMEKENNRAKIKNKKRENARILCLVEFAYANDPRIIKRTRDEAEKKARAKREKEEAKQKELDRIAREAEEARQKKAEEDRIAAEEQKKRKKDKDAKKKILQKARSRCRNIMKGLLPELTPRECEQYMTMVEKLCLTLSAEDLHSFSDKWEPLLKDDLREDFIELLIERHTELCEVEMSEDERKASQLKREQDRLAKEKAEAAAKEAEWTPQELTMLTQGVRKYPGGVPNRWKKIAEFIGTKTEREVLAKTKMAKPAQVVGVNKTHTDDFEKFKQVTKAKGNVEVNAPLTQRIPEVDSDAVAGDSKQTNGVTNDKSANGPTGASSSSSTSSSSKPSASEAGEAKPASAWTPEQQKGLEEGLKKYAASVADRWTKVATHVPGKSADDCLKRYEHLREQVRLKKQRMKEAQAATAQKKA